MYARIVGTGSYVPSTVLNNAALEATLETSDEWIVNRTGIRERRIASASDTTTSMACAAVRMALAYAGLSPLAIELLIVATSTGEYAFPSVACALQAELEIPDAIAFDVSAACTGFLYSLSIAEQYIRSGTVKCAVVVGSDVFSRTIRPGDRSTKILFGDGAGALILSASHQAGILATHLHAAGQHGGLLQLPNPLWWDLEASYLSMQGNEVFRLAVTALTELVTEILEKQGMTSEQVDWLIPHQANLRILRAITKRLNLPESKVVVTLEYHGNTGAASVPIAFDIAVRDGRIQLNDTILLEAFGGGLTWGGALVKF